MAIVRWSDPFREFAELQQRVNRAFSDAYGAAHVDALSWLLAGIPLAAGLLLAGRGMQAMRAAARPALTPAD